MPKKPDSQALALKSFSPLPNAGALFFESSTMSFEAIHAEIMLARPYLIPRERTEKGIRNGYSYWLRVPPSKELRVIRLSQEEGSYELVRSASERQTLAKVRQRFSGSVSELLAIIDEQVEIIRKHDLVGFPG
ncbi:hypothetical protein [Cupriavidus pinatubonensis]|uniref:hypothetical protein n=1 Tax=Cupriavidus pinatubonensis TaxID=248026 RepID=UPI003607C53F